MALRPLLALALGCAASPATAAAAPAGLKLHNMFSSGMVMQAEAPVLYGTAPGPGLTITVTVDDDRAVPTQAAADGSWTVRLPPRAASDPTQRGHTVVIGCDGHGWTVELKDVLFGDVWVCSGQSNMEFSTAEAFGDDGAVGGLIADALQPGLRLYAVQKNSSTEPLAEAVDLMYPGGWVHSTPKTVCGAEYNNDGYHPPSNTSAYCGPHCGPSAVQAGFKRATWGYFSAVCYATGRALLRDTGRPQGMIESCWGGTRIESWTPVAPVNAPASEQQRHVNVPVDAEEGANKPASLYNGMISVLQKFPIKGTLWYQGEANAHSANLYANQMRTMISDWRNGWVGAPTPLRNFTFILHQLSAYSNDKKACALGPSPPPAIRDPAIPALRWSQQGSVAPWTGANGQDLPRVAMTVGIDLSDPGSPCGCVHIRNKTAVGERMALAARALAYGESIHYTGPVASAITIAGSQLFVSFSGAALPLSFRTIAQTTLPDQQGVEVLLANDTWRPVPAKVSASLPEIIAELPAMVVKAVRYGWDDIPATQLLYDSAIYGACHTARGHGLFGLPAPPFWCAQHS